MAKTDTRLITFAISHYCEKARWALDWYGIDYTEIGWPPGIHRILAKRAGAKGGSVPLLLTGDEVIEGSDAIIDWAAANATGAKPDLCPADRSAAIRQTENRLDKLAGVNVRRFVYSHVMPDKAHYVKPMLFANTGFVHRLAGYLMWPACIRLIVKGYKLNSHSAAESLAILEVEFAWLEENLRPGHGYLAGDTFTRADLTAASLLAPFARPAEMPIYHDAQYPDDLMRTLDAWKNRPVMKWVRQIYRDHRY
ncbi:MAG: hypothetical protein HKN11_09775 [Rhizobiales bacterium]|nr:hypothetical protein [Hyphomicrobiales bacterium]